MNYKKIKLFNKNNTLYYKEVFFNKKLNISDFDNIFYDGETLFFRTYNRYAFEKEFCYECDELLANSILKSYGLFCFIDIRGRLYLMKNHVDNTFLYGKSFIGSPDKIIPYIKNVEYQIPNDVIDSYDIIQKRMHSTKNINQYLFVKIPNYKNFFNGNIDPMDRLQGQLGVNYFYDTKENIPERNYVIDLNQNIEPIEFAKANLNTHI